MTDVELDIVLKRSDHDTLTSAVEQARLAESYGFDRVTAGETTGWNVIPLLATIAARTDVIGISNDVLSPYSRSPALVGQTALTMQEATAGRYRLGLGTSSPALAEDWHGTGFDRPLRRLRETIEIVRRIYEGDEVTYDGEIYDLDGLRYDRPLPDRCPPIDVAALGPKAVELTGRFANGWVPHLFTTDGLRDRITDLKRGMELGARDDAQVRISPSVRCFAHEDPDHARSLARRTIAFLVGAYGPFYGQSVARQGYEGVVSEIRTAWQHRDIDEMASALPDDLLTELAAVGTPADVREQVRAFLAVPGVDAIRVGFVDGMSQAEKVTTMEAVTALR